MLTATYQDPPATVRKVVMKQVVLMRKGQGLRAVVVGERWRSCDWTICPVLWTSQTCLRQKLPHEILRFCMRRQANCMGHSSDHDPCVSQSMQYALSQCSVCWMYTAVSVCTTNETSETMRKKPAYMYFRRVRFSGCECFGDVERNVLLRDIVPPKSCELCRPLGSSLPSYRRGVCE